MKVRAIVFMLLAFPTMMNAQDSAMIILKNAALTLASHEGVLIKARFGSNAIVSDEDSATCWATVKMLRQPSDKKYHGYFWLFPDDEYRYLFYDLQNVYLYDTMYRQADRFSPGNEPWDPTGNWNVEKQMLWKEFLEPERMLADVSAGEVRQGPDSTVDGIHCRVVIIHFPDSEVSREKTTTYLISRAENIPIRRRSVWMSGSESKSEEYRIAYHRFDGISADDFSASQIPEDVQIKDLPDTTKRSNEPRLLRKGTPAPGIAGVRLIAPCIRDSLIFSNNVTILFFFESYCPWCIKSLTPLKKIIRTYGEKGVRVVGINSVDNKPGRKERIRQFLGADTTRIPVLLVSKATEDAYKAEGWPGFYIIDKQGNVAAAYGGYFQGLYKELSGKIEKLLE
jgi:hypothetical protein